MIIVKNITKIKYIKVLNKLYEITHISFEDMTIKAVEAVDNSKIPENEIFSVNELKEFNIKLLNNSGMADIVDFKAWVDKKKANETGISY